jgi:hypothetical protein
MSEKERRAVKAAIRRLYAARLDADYQPFLSIDISVARNALIDAKMVLQAVGSL